MYNNRHVGTLANYEQRYAVDDHSNKLITLF